MQRLPGPWPKKRRRRFLRQCRSAQEDTDGAAPSCRVAPWVRAMLGGRRGFRVVLLATLVATLVAWATGEAPADSEQAGVFLELHANLPRLCFAGAPVRVSREEVLDTEFARKTTVVPAFAKNHSKIFESNKWFQTHGCTRTNLERYAQRCHIHLGEPTIPPPPPPPADAFPGPLRP